MVSFTVVLAHFLTLHSPATLFVVPSPGKKEGGNEEKRKMSTRTVNYSSEHSYVGTSEHPLSHELGSERVSQRANK